MSGRPSRRAAAKRQRVVESSDSEEADEVNNEEEDEEETYTPVAATPRRTTKRATATPASSAPAARGTRARRTAPAEATARVTKSSARGRGGRATRGRQVREESEAPAEPIAVAQEEASEAPTPAPAPSSPAPVESRQPTPRAQTPSVQQAPPTPQQQTPRQAPPSRLPSLAPQTPRHATPTPGQGFLGSPAPATPTHPRTPFGRGTPVQVGRPSPARTEIAPSPVKSLLNVPGAISSTQAPTQSQNLPLIEVKSRTSTLTDSAEPEVPKQRLVITHLVLNNFKSYAGERMVGPFHPSFTSVVGPNGSGKSNVIDSLLFVFGFRASKMRQGKISALIHNSAAFPDLDFCEVKVYFQEVIDLPDGGHEVIPDSDLVISRRAFKNNSSRYYINGAGSDYTQVTTLLRGRGIDLDHKRFLILQGEVESIAQMKPKAQHEHDDGLLEYLEDIIGTSKYKQPIQESETQAEELNDVCVEKSTRVQHVEKEKNALEDKKNSALSFIQTENELAKLKSALYQNNIYSSEKNINVTSELITQLQAELDTELEKFNGSNEKIKALENKYNQAAAEIEEVEKETQAILREKSRTDKEKVKSQEKEKFLAQKQKKLQKTISQSRLQASEANAMIERSGQDRERCDGEVAEKKEELAQEEENLETILGSLKEKTQVFSDEIAGKQKILEPYKEKINEKQSAIAVAQSELDMISQRENSSRQALEEAQAKIGQIEESRNEKEIELEECRKEKAVLQKKAQKLQAKIQEEAKKEPQLKDKLSSARSKADEARSAMAETQSQGLVLTTLLRLSESGRIDGFHGRLGGLATIDDKYQIAISAACPQLENMVVETKDIGDQCVAHLRKNNSGRASFMMLDSIQKRNMNRIDTPEGAPRLFDLLKLKDPKFAPAFYQVLQDTLVAESTEQAKRLAYGQKKRWRVVTLQGTLFESAGSMTGGGKSRPPVRMSSKLPAQISKAAIQELEQTRDQLEAAYNEFLNQQRQLQSELRDVQERIPELDVTMSKIELEIKASAQHMEDAKRRIAETKKEMGASTTDKSRVAALQKTIKSLEKEIEKLQAETADVEEEIRALNDKISQAGGAALRGSKATVALIKEQLDTLNEEISKADLNRSKAAKQLKKAEKALKAAEEEFAANEIELQGLQEDIKELEKEASEKQGQAEEAEAFLEQKKDELAEAKKHVDEKRDELNASRAAEIEMKNKLENHQKVLLDNQHKARHWQAELAKLKLHDITEFTGETVDEQNRPTFDQYTEDELQEMDRDQLKTDIAVLEQKIKDINVDLSVLAEYKRRVEEHKARSDDLQEAVNNRDAVKQRLDDLRKRRLDEFMEGFNLISLRLKEMYQMITMGGNAELELVDSLDPFSEGILFSVMPPKKSWKNISNLSGGEKTLSSLALVFALHHYKPTPLYVMDEIDAALDFRNVSIVAGYIKERTKNAQFIVISLRNNMFELAARLVGVYKVNHMTKSVTIENKPYIEGGSA